MYMGCVFLVPPFRVPAQYLAPHLGLRMRIPPQFYRGKDRVDPTFDPKAEEAETCDRVWNDAKLGHYAGGDNRRLSYVCRARLCGFSF